VGSGGILYTGNVGGSSAHDVALNIVNANAANGVTVNIIDNTPRGLLLDNSGVKGAILAATQEIYESQGMTAPQAQAAALNFLYGSTTVPTGQEGSVATSLWGQASTDFAGSGNQQSSRCTVALCRRSWARKRQPWAYPFAATFAEAA
jgi:hypothetical protein